ncbi:MAG: iron-containing alcohol dehydrogenase [Clostridiales bacterium]|nr:iron-containing alcohol dehydrogenase [Clostridiales bacterium]
MQNFEYYTPTKVFFGRGVEEKLGQTIRDLGFRKILLHYGSGRIKKTGLYDKITKNLTELGISYCELGGVEPNPKLSLVREGVELGKRENVDMILAVGGGSVIDSAKAIGLSLANDLDPWYMVENYRKLDKIEKFPVGVVLTLAAAGSEMSNSLVITHDEAKLKRSINTDANRPIFAFMNPELTYSVSKYQTACGIVDIMMHTMERYYSPEKGADLTDRISEGLLVSVKDAGLVVINEPDNYEARATLMWASSLSHNGITECGRSRLMPAHRISHDISGIFEVAHGAALSVVFPAWAKYEYKKDIEKFAQMATRVWGIELDEDNPEKTALLGIETMKEYFRTIGMPVSMKEIGIEEKDYELLVNATTNNGKAGVESYDVLSKEDILNIYKLAQ